jgi:hypothetical protein
MIPRRCSPVRNRLDARALRVSVRALPMPPLVSLGGSHGRSARVRVLCGGREGGHAAAGEGVDRVPAPALGCSLSPAPLAPDRPEHPSNDGRASCMPPLAAPVRPCTLAWAPVHHAPLETRAQNIGHRCHGTPRKAKQSPSASSGWAADTTHMQSSNSAVAVPQSAHSSRYTSPGER